MIADGFRIAYVVDGTGFLTPRNGGEEKRRSLATSLAGSGDLTIFIVPASDGDTAAPPALEVALDDGRTATVKMLRPLRGDGRTASIGQRVVDIARRNQFERLRETGIPTELLSGYASASASVKADVVVVDAPHLYGTAQCWSVPSIVVTQNHESRTYASRAFARSTSPHQRFALLFAAAGFLFDERSIARHASQLWVVSEDDANQYRRRFPSLNVRVVLNVVSRHTKPAGAPTLNPPTIAFLGSLNYGPNREAAILFGELAARLQNSGTDCRAIVIGGDANEALKAALAATPVEQLGFVDNLDHVLSSVAAVVAPLGRGGGTKLKVLDSLARALPVVTTPDGVIGLDGLEAGCHAHVAPLGPQFDESVRRVLQDPVAARTMGVVGREWVLTNFGSHRLDELVASHLAEVVT